MLQFIRRKRNNPEKTQEQSQEQSASETLTKTNNQAGATPAAPSATNRQPTESQASVDAPTQEPTTAVVDSNQTSLADTAINAKKEIPENKPGFFGRLATRISKTSSNLGDGLGQILLGQKEIDDELLEDIETQLLTADIGIDTTKKITDALASAIERDALTNPKTLYKQLKKELKNNLGEAEPFVIDTHKAPYVILVVGVNGAGKTTTIGKLAKRFQNESLSVMLAAGDTFRAAAVEQLQVWGERNNVPVVAQSTGSDSASVIYDALQSAKARDVDILIADTAGRLHNKDNLMEELKKVVRVMQKIDPKAPHEILLVLDSTTGQNAIAQAQKFKEAVGVTGLAVTKLDGTAKGGVVFAINESLNLPIRFIGVGESISDLRPFDPDEFVEAIFEQVEGF